MSKLSDYRDLLNPLLMSQRLAVLATYYDGQPFSNLVAFAATNDLKHILFATSRNTRKYNNLRENKKVAMLIDSRKNEISDFGSAFALTAVGLAEETTVAERNFLSKLYLAKHPSLTEFLSMLDSALIRVAVSDYILAGFNKSQRFRISD
jgi:uncharacterized pyridoxamine 5'-phosphate oxidase family protein